MAQHNPERNPFILLLNPEVVLAAIANSERLGQLNRHLCRPLDRPAQGGAKTGNGAAVGAAAVAIDPCEDGDEPPEAAALD